MYLRKSLTLLAACCGLLFLVISASAQEPVTIAPLAAAPSVKQQPVEISPAKRALILKFLEITDAKAMNVTVMDEYVKHMTSLADQRRNQRIETDKNLTPAEKEERIAVATADSSRINQRTMAFFKEKMNFGELLENISLEIYNRHFTEAELQDLVTFYESPTGRKMIKVTPQLIQESFALTAAKMETVMQDFYKFLDQLLEQQDEELVKPVSPQATPPAQKPR